MPALAKEIDRYKKYQTTYLEGEKNVEGFVTSVPSLAGASSASPKADKGKNKNIPSSEQVARAQARTKSQVQNPNKTRPKQR